MDYRLGIIGGGNMAEAILRGLLRGNHIPHAAIVISDASLERRTHISSTIGVAAVEANRVPAGCPLVVLAVKPQVMGDVLKEVAPAVRPDAVVISIAAGITTRFIDAQFGGRGRIIRVMPNTPLLVGRGMAAIAAGPRATPQDMHLAKRVFGDSGLTCEVAEEQMDAVTAVSGSGPAYFFYLVEAMVEAGVADGLDAQTALLLATQTCAGAAAMLAETQTTPEVLRARVTSPNGTTQRAIETMDSAGVKASLIKAIRAAAARSRELGK